MSDTPSMDFILVRHSDFSSIFKLLCMEATLCANCLCTGLTSIRKADHTRADQYYNAFINLSIGLERLFKLILLVHTYLESKTFLSDKELRALGHNLTALSDKAAHCFNPDGYPYNTVQDHIYDNIIKELSEFAQTLRYHNLTQISQTETQSTGPLERWFQHVEKPLLLRNIVKCEALVKTYGSQAYQKAFLNNVILNFPDFNLLFRPVEFQDLFAISKISSLLQKEVTLHVGKIIKTYSQGLVVLEDRAHEAKSHDIPYFHEFFLMFDIEDRRFKQLKKWSLIPS